MIKTREDREKAVKAALANGALEGMRPKPEFKALLDRYIAGEISLDDAIADTKAKFQRKQNVDNTISEGLKVLKQLGL
jgi:hypothetical protein